MRQISSTWEQSNRSISYLHLLHVDRTLSKNVILYICLIDPHSITTFCFSQWQHIKKKEKCTPHPPSHLNSSSSKVLLHLISLFAKTEPKLLILYWQTVLLALLYWAASPVEKLSEGLVYPHHCQFSPSEWHTDWLIKYCAGKYLHPVFHSEYYLIEDQFTKHCGRPVTWNVHTDPANHYIAFKCW